MSEPLRPLAGRPDRWRTARTWTTSCGGRTARCAGRTGRLGARPPRSGARSAGRRSAPRTRSSRSRRAGRAGVLDRVHRGAPREAAPERGDVRDVRVVLARVRPRPAVLRRVRDAAQARGGVRGPVAGPSPSDVLRLPVPGRVHGAGEPVPRVTGGSPFVTGARSPVASSAFRASPGGHFSEVRVDWRTVHAPVESAAGCRVALEPRPRRREIPPSREQLRHGPLRARVVTYRSRPPIPPGRADAK